MKRSKKTHPDGTSTDSASTAVGPDTVLPTAVLRPLQKKIGEGRGNLKARSAAFKKRHMAS